MGDWGTAPWEHDGGADWFGEVLEASELPAPDIVAMIEIETGVLSNRLSR